MLHIHPSGLTTPVSRAEIGRSAEPSGITAKHHGTSAEIVRSEAPPTA